MRFLLESDSRPLYYAYFFPFYILFVHPQQHVQNFIKLYVIQFEVIRYTVWSYMLYSLKLYGLKLYVIRFDKALILPLKKFSPFFVWLQPTGQIQDWRLEFLGEKFTLVNSWLIFFSLTSFRYMQLRNF